MNRLVTVTDKACGDDDWFDPIPLPASGGKFPMMERDKAIHSVPMVSKVNHFYLIDEIVEPTEYLEIIKAFNMASEMDTFVIHINCWGGDLYTAIQLYYAICTTRARVKASIEGACASAATMIALACDEWLVAQFATFMIHAPSAGNFGKANERKQSQDYEDRWNLKLFQNVYAGFLSDKEIEKCLDGRDYWFDADETLDRLTKGVIPWREAKKKEFLDAQQAATNSNSGKSRKAKKPAKESKASEDKPVEQVES